MILLRPSSRLLRELSRLLVAPRPVRSGRDDDRWPDRHHHRRRRRRRRHRRRTAHIDNMYFNTTAGTVRTYIIIIHTYGDLWYLYT